ncbi:hypothetical protein LuPra_04029 [Luteitalea pratensis]|uniref:Uncharacterized protein n=1 Tax=Luteitalea pratensis TaxID=1855912 RepID=A0A143PRM4_LUTPR|nr:hypothetical protein LuPra_04029 [Luteitalea pratensis]
MRPAFETANRLVDANRLTPGVSWVFQASIEASAPGAAAVPAKQTELPPFAAANAWTSASEALASKK